ncbi:MAG: DUF4331 family protein [Candidatus Korobacteraceae bacterium]
MSDHQSGPRALADPVVDITDMYAFPNPERPSSLVLVLNVFPNAEPATLFSDAVDYRFRVRPARTAARGAGAAFAVSEEEYTLSCRFAVPVDRKGGGAPVQEGVCTSSTGQSVSFRVDDEQGATGEGLRVFAGHRLDPFFFDAMKTFQTLKTGKLSYVTPGTSRQFRQNVLSIVVEVDIATMFGAKGGPLFAVVGETTTIGSIAFRLQHFGRPQITLTLAPQHLDTVNRNLQILDLWQQENPFKIGPAYLGAFRARFNANLAFWDGLDGKVDWPLGADGAHPLTELLLANFMVVDVSKPYAEDSYFEIERALLKNGTHQTCGGRTPNDDTGETYLTMLVNAGNGPRISDGVDQQSVRASRAFPYLAPPDPDPPAVAKV